jgi:hypothetical protein
MSLCWKFAGAITMTFPSTHSALISFAHWRKSSSDMRRPRGRGAPGAQKIFGWVVAMLMDGHRRKLVEL